MKRFTKQLQDRTKTVQMTASERSALRNQIKTYMEYHPVTATAKQSSDPALTTASSTTRWWSRWRSVAAAVTVFMVALVPLAAERSMPGDMLYAVKVKFNEEVRGSLSATSYDEVEWATERLNRRLVEAQLLAQEGKLTTAVETEVAAAVREHSAKARESIAMMREENPDEAAIAEIALNALLDVHSSVLAAQKVETATGTAAVAMVAVEPAGGAISEALTASRQESDNETVSVPRPSAERLLSQIETETAKAYTLLEQIEPATATTVLATVPRRLEDVDRKVQAAVEARDAGEDIEARVLLTEALVRTRKVITYVQNWQLGSEVDIDQIVQIEYTAIELTERLHFKEERLQVRYEYILSVVDEYATTTSATEATSLLVAVPTQFASSTAAINAKDFATAGTILHDIERALDAVVAALSIPNRLPDPVVETATTTATSSASPLVTLKPYLVAPQ